MVEEVFVTEETVALAKEKATGMLGVPEKEIEFEILQSPEKKVLGMFGGKSAQIKATLKKTPSRDAKNFVKELLYYMGLSSLTVNGENCEDNICNIHIEGEPEEIQCAIGHHGETLDSIQYLTGIAANASKNLDKKTFLKIRIEAGNYRENRKISLEGLAKKIAKKVIDTGKKVSLEPMRSYERMIIHTTIEALPGVKSWSEGEFKDRHIVVVPE